MNSFGEILIVKLELEKNNFFENSGAIYFQQELNNIFHQKKNCQ
jgi:hypothetical protein